MDPADATKPSRLVFYAIINGQMLLSCRLLMPINSYQLCTTCDKYEWIGIDIGYPPGMTSEFKLYLYPNRSCL